MAAMNKPNDSFSSNRRTFIKKTTGAVTATSALAGVTIPRVHASMDDFTKVALVGAGGRGTGAAANALSVPEDIARTKLVSMADVSTAKMENSFRALKRRGKDRVDVPEDRRYIGFDGYAKAMEMAVTGDNITAPEALEFGLLSQTTEDGAALDAAVALAERIAKNAPLAVAASKKLVKAAAQGYDEAELWKMQGELMGKVFGSNDAKEGPKAFAEKREPNWTGT